MFVRETTELAKVIGYRDLEISIHSSVGVQNEIVQKLR